MERDVRDHAALYSGQGRSRPASPAGRGAFCGSRTSFGPSRIHRTGGGGKRHVRREAPGHPLPDAVNPCQRFHRAEWPTPITALDNAGGERWANPWKRLDGRGARGIKIDERPRHDVPLRWCHLPRQRRVTNRASARCGPGASVARACRLSLLPDRFHASDLRVEREHLLRCRDRSCLFRLDDPGHNAQGSNGGDYGKGATFGGS